MKYAAAFTVCLAAFLLWNFAWKVNSAECAWCNGLYCIDSSICGDCFCLKQREFDPNGYCTLSAGQYKANPEAYDHLISGNRLPE